MWTAKATIPPIKTRLAALRIARITIPIEQTTPERVDQLNGCLDVAIRDLQLLLDCVEDFQKQHATVLELARTLSDNPSTENARNTGRTARLVMRAMIALSAGKDVAVVGLNQQQAMSLKVDVERHARSWHIPYDGGPTTPYHSRENPNERAPMVLAWPMDSSNVMERAGFRGVTLVDHSVLERMEAVAGVEPVAEEVV